MIFDAYDQTEFQLWGIGNVHSFLSFASDSLALNLASLEPGAAGSSADFDLWRIQLREQASEALVSQLGNDTSADLQGTRDDASPQGMKKLWLEMELSADANNEPIVIIGRRPPLPDLDGGGLGSGGSTGGGGGTSGGGTGTETVMYPTCVEAAPNGIPPDDILNAAKALASQIEAANNKQWEYGAFVYTLNGDVYVTAIHTSQRVDSITWSTSWLPVGAHIVAMVHSHPELNDGTDQRVLSPTDWNAYNTLQQRQTAGTLPNGITMDPNALMFLYSDVDNALRAYDKTDKSQRTPGCVIK